MKLVEKIREIVAKNRTCSNAIRKELSNTTGVTPEFALVMMESDAKAKDEYIHELTNRLDLTVCSYAACNDRMKKALSVASNRMISMMVELTQKKPNLTKVRDTAESIDSLLRMYNDYVAKGGCRKG